MLALSAQGRFAQGRALVLYRTWHHHHSVQLMNSNRKPLTCLHRNGTRIQDPVLMRRQSATYLQRSTIARKTAFLFVPQHELDKVATEYELIYSCYQANKGFRMFIYGVVAIYMWGVMAYFPMKFHGYINLYQTFTLPIINETVVVIPFMLKVISCMYFISLGLIVRSYGRLLISRIYESPCKTKYIGIWKNFFVRDKVEFTLQDVEKVSSKALLIKGNTRIKGRNCMVYMIDFKSPSHFTKFVHEQLPKEAKNKS